MQKETMNVDNIRNGDFRREIDAAIIAMNLDLDRNADNEKAANKITITIDLKRAGEGGNFRAVSAIVTPTPCKPAKVFDLYGVQVVDGQRVIVADPVGEEDDDGQIHMFEGQPAGLAPQPGVAQFARPQAVNG